MESISGKSLISEIISRITEPAKYKLRLYQIAVLLFIDRVLSMVISKYMYLRVKIEEKKIDLKLDKLHQSEVKIDLLTKDLAEKFSNFKLKIGKGYDYLQSMHTDCVTADETPALFCEPYIHTGFRPLNKPYMYYVKSLFTKHNETINAWSHYIGFIYVLYLGFTFDFYNPYSWPILTSVLTSLCMFFASATAHLMHQKSHSCHMNCFLCDFGGISFNAFGASLMQLYVCSPAWYFNALEPYLLPVLGVLSALCCLLNSIAQTKYKRPYPQMKKILQVAPCGFLWVFSMVPVFIGFFDFLRKDYNLDTELKIGYEFHLLHIAIFLFGAAFFALEFPQRFFPGRLDFIGQGHNIFHVCILIVVSMQLHACYADFETNKEILATIRKPPTISYCFLSLAALTLYYMYIIRTFSRMIVHNFDKDGNFIDKTEEDNQLGLKED